MRSILASAVTAAVFLAVGTGLWLITRPRRPAARTRLRVGSTELCQLVTRRGYEAVEVADGVLGGPRPVVIFERWACGLAAGHRGLCVPVLIIDGAAGEPVIVQPRA